MITIRGLFFVINIDDNQEYVIYDKSYHADMYGNPLPEDSEEVKKGHFYDFGDIVIETKTKRYTLKKVCDSYQWVWCIIDYIYATRTNEKIFIDMYKLDKIGDDLYREPDCDPKLIVEDIVVSNDTN